MLTKITKNGWIIVILLCLIPVVLWFSVKDPSDRFFSKYETFTSLGELASLIGITLFAISIILSSRLKIIEQFIKGMNKAYINHHIIGGISFILLLLHPIFLTMPYLFTSLTSAMNFIFPSFDFWDTYFGIAALFFMMTLLFVTFFAKLPYQIWKMTHKFLGVAFFIGSIHAVFSPSDMTSYMPLRYYMIALLAIAFILYLYRSVFWKFLVPTLPYSVTAVKDLGSKTFEISLSPDKKALRYAPGQFIFIYFTAPGISSESHPFSLISAPTEPNLTLAIKESGDYTAGIGKLAIGAKASVEGPFGAFSMANGSGNQIWIAGGIGVTPFVSMAKALNGEKVTLFYCMSDKSENQYLNLLNEIQNELLGFRVVPFYSKDYGRIAAEEISKLEGVTPKTEFFVCGPPPMMKSIRDQLVLMGVRQGNIHSEEFSID